MCEKDLGLTVLKRLLDNRLRIFSCFRFFFVLGILAYFAIFCLLPKHREDGKIHHDPLLSKDPKASVRVGSRVRLAAWQDAENRGLALRDFGGWIFAGETMKKAFSSIP